MPWNNQLRSRCTSSSLDCLEVGGAFRSDVCYFWNLRQKLDCATAYVKIVLLWSAAKYLVGYKTRGSCAAVQRLIQFHFIALYQLVIWRNSINCHRFIFFYAFCYTYQFCNIIQLSVNRISVIFRGRHLVWKNITRVGTLIVATIYLQLIQNRYMFRNFTVLQYSHQHCVQPVASDVEVVGYL